MGAIVVGPRPFTVVAADAESIAPASNMNLDHASLVWRAPSSTLASVTVEGDGSMIDTVALIGSNLSPDDSVIVRIASTEAGLDSAAPVSVPAFTGTKHDAITAKTVIMLTEAVEFEFVRVSVANTTAKAIQAQRLVIGRRIETVGVNYGYEAGYVDQSTDYADAPVLPTAKATFSYQRDSVWRDKWQALLADRGLRKGVLLCPNTYDMHPNDIIFGNIIAAPKGVVGSYDAWEIELNLQGFSL